MADDLHIFVASGESCPICTAMDGELVPAGYTAHDNCHCQTIPRDGGGECSWDVSSETHRDGNGPMDATIGFEVTVTCPDGSMAGASGEFDAHPYGESDAEFDRFIADFDGAAEDLAQEICDSCAEEKPFLCC